MQWVLRRYSFLAAEKAARKRHHYLSVNSKGIKLDSGYRLDIVVVDEIEEQPRSIEQYIFHRLSENITVFLCSLGDAAVSNV